MTEMKRMSDCLSPIGWLILLFASYFPMMLILHPSWAELGVLIGVDTVTAFFTGALEGRVFMRLFPDAVPYFKGTDPMKELDESTKVRLLESLIRFPRRRATFCFFVAFPKITPGVAIVVFVWEHATSNLTQFALISGIALLNFCYFYGTVFLESHRASTRLIGELHERFDFRKAFARVPVRYRKSDFEIQVGLSLAFIIVFTLALQFSTLLIGSGTHFELALKAAAIGTTGFFLFGWEFYLHRIVIRSLSSIRSGMTARAESLPIRDLRI